MKKILLTATVQSHICQFHKPLVQMLREHGDVEIHVAARNNLSEKNGLKLDFVDKVYDIPFRRSPFDLKNISAYKQLKKIIKENEYDYIHCNTPVGGVVTRLAAKKARKKGTKVFYTAHGFHFYDGAPKKNWMVYYPIEKLLAKYTDKLITINREDFELASSDFKCKVARIHGVGVDPKRYFQVSPESSREMKKELGFDPDDTILLCVGELLPNKNQRLVISAMSKVTESFPKSRLLLAGNGPEEENLRALIKELGLEDNVKLLGYCTELEKYQRITDVSVSCSIREGLGLNVIEAMMTGNPVIATKNRGHNELVSDGQNGYLVDTNDSALLAEKIILLLDSREHAAELGSNGNKLSMKYSFESVKNELKSIYFEG